MEFEVGKKAFIRLRDVRLVDVLSEIETRRLHDASLAQNPEARLATASVVPLPVCAGVRPIYSRPDISRCRRRAKTGLGSKMIDGGDEGGFPPLFFFRGFVQAEEVANCTRLSRVSFPFVTFYTWYIVF